MMTKLTLTGLMIALTLAAPPGARADRDDFKTVVKAIEQFYHVKHRNVPLLARAGVKAVRTVAKIRGGQYKRIAEAGSARVAFFEDQTFDSHGNMAAFKASIQNMLATNWSALVQTVAPKEEEQTFIYVRDANEKFHVMAITIERHEATVVQATISPQMLAKMEVSLYGSAKQLAQRSGGEALRVNRTSDYSGALAKIIGNLTSRYSLGFALAEDEKDDGRMHELVLRVKAQDAKGKARRLDVSSRRGYYMPKIEAEQAATTK